MPTKVELEKELEETKAKLAKVEDAAAEQTECIEKLETSAAEQAECIKKLEADVNGRANREARLSDEIVSLRSSLQAQAEKLRDRGTVVVDATEDVSIPAAIAVLVTAGCLLVSGVKVEDCKTANRKTRTFRHARRYPFGLLSREKLELPALELPAEETTQSEE